MKWNNLLWIALAVAAGGGAEVSSPVAKETLGATGPVAADGPAAVKRYPARQFNSKVPLYVYVCVNSSDAVTEVELQPVGRTPTDKPLEIPACDAWWVSPAGAPLADVIKEVQAQALPGLALPPAATNDDLALVKGLTGLQTLELKCPRVTDAGLEHLKGLTGLRMLILGAQVTDAGLAHLKGMTGLQTLHLASTQVTDAGLEHLKSLTGLRTLNLSNSKVTDAGLEHLKGLTGLQTLDLSTKVTKAGVAELQKALPGTLIR
jgi:hypothetical protein